VGTLGSLDIRRQPLQWRRYASFASPRQVPFEVHHI